MNAIESVKRDLTPKFEDLLMHLNSTDQMAACFYKTLFDLNVVASEEQLLGLHRALDNRFSGNLL